MQQAGATAETVLDLSRSLIECGFSEAEIGDSAAALESLNEAVKRVEELEAIGRGSDAARFVLARALLDRGNLLEPTRPAEAIALNDRSRAILQALVDANPGVADFQDQLVRALENLGSLSSNPVDTFAAYARALAILEKLAVAKPDDWDIQDSLAITHNNIGASTFQNGQMERGAGIIPAGTCDLAKSG